VGKQRGHDGGGRATDAELCARAARGDQAAMSALYDRHKDYAYRLAYRYTRSGDLAMDAVQDAFTYVVKKITGPGRFTLTAKFTTFLFPVVKHAAQAAARKARRYAISDADVHEPSASAEADPARAAGAEGELPDHRRAELDQLLSCLSDERKEVVLLRFVDDLSLAEIGEAMGIPTGTVKSRLHLAIKELRKDPAVAAYFEMDA